MEGGPITFLKHCITLKRRRYHCETELWYVFNSVKQKYGTIVYLRSSGAVKRIYLFRVRITRLTIT